MKPVLQCVQVFAVGTRIVGSEESKDAKAAEVKNVTFLVYPLQGQLLHLANKQSNGSLQFALRSGSDKSLANSRDLSDASLSMLSNALMGNPDDVNGVSSARAVPAKPHNAFRSYLAPETSRAVTSVGEKAVRRTWKIEIFQGDQREVQEIDWPEETPKGARRTTESATPWTNPLLKFFNRRQQAEQEDLPTNQSTGAIRNTTEQPSRADSTARGTQPTEKQ